MIRVKIEMSTILDQKGVWRTNTKLKTVQKETMTFVHGFTIARVSIRLKGQNRMKFSLEFLKIIEYMYNHCFQTGDKTL